MFHPSPPKIACIEQANRGFVLRLDERVNPQDRTRANQSASGERNQFSTPTLAAKLRRHVHGELRTLAIDLKSHQAYRIADGVLANVEDRLSVLKPLGKPADVAFPGNGARMKRRRACRRIV